jgi:hypothetical protein
MRPYQVSDPQSPPVERTNKVRAAQEKNQHVLFTSAAH